MPLLKINELNVDHYTMIEEMGGTGFTPEQIAEVIEVDECDFINEFKNKRSDLYRRYRKGFLQAELILRQRIFKDAGYGSSPAQTLAKKIMDECSFKIESYA